jgi:chorismate mutase
MTVETFREEITALDLQLLETINTRIETVAELRRYKDEHGIAFLDPDRERSLLEQIKAANRGPLSEAGVEELVAFVLDLVKREVANA